MTNLQPMTTSMRQSFLQAYLQAFQRIGGWFSYDAALLFMAYNQLNTRAGISGDVLEIGVYQGLSAIAVATLRGPGRRMYAIDLFEERLEDPDYGSGQKYRQIFEGNMKAFHDPLDFLTIVSGASGTLKAGQFPHSFSFCHVDGGHTPQETFADLKFASEILVPGGLLALDDYFNPQYPGVCEGAIEFMREGGQVLRPVAIGYNKVLFQKQPAAIDLNAEFQKALPSVPQLESRPMWNTPVYLFGAPFRFALDLYASTPQRLALLNDAGVRAKFWPEQSPFKVRAGKTSALPVVVENTSREAFPEGKHVLGLSYHLLSPEGEPIRHDNARTYFRASLPPGQKVQVDLKVEAPPGKGHYRLEIDLVWEGVMWFKDVGNPTCFVALDVR